MGRLLGGAELVLDLLAGEEPRDLEVRDSRRERRLPLRGADGVGQVEEQAAGDGAGLVLPLVAVEAHDLVEELHRHGARPRRRSLK